MPHDNQEQAFPQPVTVGPNGDLYPAYPGMTLRDYFAGQALSILPARSWDVDGKTPQDIFKTWAESSYAMADAMLEARK